MGTMFYNRAWAPAPIDKYLSQTPAGVSYLTTPSCPVGSAIFNTPSRPMGRMHDGQNGRSASSDLQSDGNLIIQTFNAHLIACERVTSNLQTQQSSLKGEAR